MVARPAARPAFPPLPGGPSSAFTLLELLAVAAVIALLAAILLPALSRALAGARRASCLSNLRQQSVAWQLFLDDHQDAFPDRRDLKTSLPGGYKPWASWPASDPRAGWAAAVLAAELPEPGPWSCPALAARVFGELEQIRQPAGPGAQATVARYWMWRFDRTDQPTPDDNFWGRPASDCARSLQRAGNPAAGVVGGPSDVELVVDPYFPGGIASVPVALRGRSAHPAGRNRLMLDGSAAFLADRRLGGAQAAAW